MEALQLRAPLGTWVAWTCLLFATTSCSTLFGPRDYEESPPPAVTVPNRKAPSASRPQATTPLAEPTLPDHAEGAVAAASSPAAPPLPGLRLVPHYLWPSAADLAQSQGLTRAIGELGSGDLEAAAVSLQQLRQAGDFSSAVVALHAWVLAQTERLEAAEQVGRDGVAQFGATPPLAYAMAVIYELQARPREAMALYQDLSTLNPDDSVLIEACARTAVAAGSGEVALRWLDRLLLQAAPSLEQRRLRAQALEAADRPAEAVALYRQLASEYPMDGELLESLTQSAFAAASRSGNEGDWEQARDLQRQLTELDPQHAGAFYRLGFAERRLGNPIEATAAWRRCLEIEPDHVAAARSLAALLTDLGDVEGAAKVLLEVLRQPLRAKDVDAVQQQIFMLEQQATSS